MKKEDKKILKGSKKYKIIYASNFGILKVILKKAKTVTLPNIILAWNLTIYWFLISMILMIWIVVCLCGLLILFLKKSFKLLKKMGI